jgi:hypothetical protein
VGIEKVQLCMKGLCFESKEKGFKEKIPTKFLNNLEIYESVH